MFRNLLFILLVLIVALSPQWTLAKIYMTLDEPFSGFSSNDVGDIVYMDLPGGERIIWVGTAKGISKTSDGGASWSFYDQRNGLNQNIVSALAVSGTTLWAATAYSKLVQGALWPYGSGFNKTDDLGDNWESLTPAQLNFAGEVSYDMATDDTTVWAAAWYGGLIRSQDGGQTWENLFVDSAAQKDFEEGRLDTLYRNYLFAVAVDTLCPLDKRLKNWINDVAYDGKLVWVATRNGLHSSVDLGKSWFAYDTTSGLNSNAVLSLTGDTSSFWAGLYQEEGVYPFQLLPPLVGADFNRTTDYGATWASSHPDQGQASSLEELPYDITLADTVVWAACGKGGLIRSFDRGETWENVFADTSAKRRFEEDVLEENDVFTSLAVDTFNVDTTVLWAGTRDGIYKFIFTTSDSADTVFQYLHFGVVEGSGSSLIEWPFESLYIGIHRHEDQHLVWAGGYGYWNQGHLPPGDYVHPIAYMSTDGGANWGTYLDGILIRDFAFLDSTVWAASDEGLKRSTDGGENWDTFE
ncbi:MAG: hypothetical protein WBC98_03190, partial [Candidatus Zixiibacteriota bacterium]